MVPMSIMFDIVSLFLLSASLNPKFSYISTTYCTMQAFEVTIPAVIEHQIIPLNEFRKSFRDLSEIQTALCDTDTVGSISTAKQFKIFLFLQERPHILFCSSYSHDFLPFQLSSVFLPSCCQTAWCFHRLLSLCLSYPSNN